MRSVPEWKGKTDDEQPPPHIRLRIFERHSGVCGISGRRIRPGERWELDHVVALVNGGLNDERNLIPVLYACHKQKTREDVALKSRNYRKKAYHLGVKRKKGRPIPGSRSSGLKKCMDGRVIKR